MLTGAPQAQVDSDQGFSEGQDRLMIVSGNSGRVVYDDGRDDLYCVTSRYTAAYDYYGRPIRRRSMNCRCAGADHTLFNLGLIKEGYVSMPRCAHPSGEALVRQLAEGRYYQ